MVWFRKLEILVKQAKGNKKYWMQNITIGYTFGNFIFHQASSWWQLRILFFTKQAPDRLGDKMAKIEKIVDCGQRKLFFCIGLVQEV